MHNMQASALSQARCGAPSIICRRPQWPPLRSPAARRRACRMQCAARVLISDPVSGVQFPLAQSFWEGEEFRCLGTGTRVKKILVISAKVYSAALYVEAERAAKELGVRYRGGFFSTDDDYGQALVDGAFSKAVLCHLVRDIEGQQFADAINDKLGAKMQLTGNTAALQEFLGFFSGKKLSTGTEVVCFWSASANDLEVAVISPGQIPESYASTVPQITIASAGLARGLFEMFLGSGAVVPDARAAWVEGAKLLLESEQVKRAARKAGS